MSVEINKTYNVILWSVPTAHNERVNEEANGFRDLPRPSRLVGKALGVELTV